MTSELPLEVRSVDPEMNKQLLEDFTGERTGFVQVGPEKWFLPSGYLQQGANLYHFKPRPDDTWVVTFPRSGTTWTQEMVWLIANNLDYDTARNSPLVERFPFLEFSIFVHDETKKEFLAQFVDDPKKQELVERISRPAYEILEEMTSPRFIKTHFPFSLLPPGLMDSGCKVVYVARNPKDVAVSFYHLNRLIRTQGYQGDFAKYWDYFENNLHPWTPYWSHVQEGWDGRHHPNMLFLFYEEMNKDLPGTIRRVSEFLGHPLTQNQVDTLSEYLHIDNFKSNSAVNMDVLKEAGMLTDWNHKFIRKGQNGGWVDEFTPELSQRADQWIQDHLKETDIRFPPMYT